jgi:uncharacterized protein (TIGR00369 family)
MLSAQKIEQIHASFAAQGAMRLIDAKLTKVESGRVEIECAFRPELSQQHGFFHAGITSTLVDTAGGYAALTLMGESDEVLTVEFKLNLLAPAKGQRLRAQGEVVKSGRTLTVAQGKVWCYDGGRETLCALMQQTLIAISKT